MKMIHETIILICLILVSSLASAEEFSCRRDLTPDDNPTIAYKQRGNRCEGFYQIPVSVESLNLVSLLYGKLDFDVSNNKSLRIFAPKIMKQQVHIQAVGIPLRTYYRLDAWLQPGAEFIWPLDVVNRMQLWPTDIGLLGKPVTNPDFYTPLIIGKKEVSTAPLNIILRSSVDVQTLFWRRSKMNQRRCGQPESEWKEIQPDWADCFVSGEAIPLSILGQEENFCIEFRAQAKGSGTWLELAAMGILLKE